ncbi:transglycosylase SLT domain-containing protein [Sinorhizobium fredii]|uniref:transglycosylase SLT domain-containing protein n=1 Tax=Rhizobium fredii TaxID=380 RepID=UPI0030B2B24E
MDAAKQFFATVPKALQPEYDAKLFTEEDSFLSRARAFENTQRTQFYGDEVNKGLTTIENDLFSNPANFDKNLDKGLEFINSIPDEHVTRIQKADLAQQWRKKAQLAALNGVTPQERIRLLGGNPDVPDVLPSAGRAQAMTRGISGDVRKIVSDAAAAYGVDPNALLTIAWIESRGNPNAKNPNSSAGGLFQFIDSTARGYGLQNKFDPAQAADAAARLTRDNSEALEKVLGRKPTTGELYLAHQQGIGGATKLLSNPNARAVDAVGADAVRLNGGSADMTASDFASLWMKKAGDTHIPDGGVFNAQYDASRADPRFADLNYAEAEKVIHGARVEIGNAREAEAANLKATQAQAYDDYRLRIAADDPTLTADDIMQDARLETGNKATLLDSFNAAVEDGASTREFIASYSSGQGVVNPFDTNQKKAADKGFERLAAAIEEPEQRAAFATDFVKQTQYIPAVIQDQLRYGALSRDAAVVSQTLEAAASLSRSAPQSFASFEGSAAVQSKLDAFNAYRSLGYTSEEAGQRVIDANDPEKVRQRDAILKSDTVVNDLKKIGSSDVADIFDDAIIGSPTVGGTATAREVQIGVNPQAEAVIVSDYQDLVKDALVSTYGDMDAAKAIAGERMRRIYGTSSFSMLGDSIVVRRPVELSYPAGPSGTHDYVREQLAADMKGEGIEAENFFLQGDTTTERDIEAGKPARYLVFYKDENGLLQMHRDRWYVDLPAAQQRFQVERDEAVQRAEERFQQNRAEALERQQTAPKTRTGTPVPELPIRFHTDKARHERNLRELGLEEKPRGVKPEQIKRAIKSSVDFFEGVFGPQKTDVPSRAALPRKKK